nr:type I toxin-antitoxin system ptaRNA1 family toxin [Zobellella endophytica]
MWEYLDREHAQQLGPLAEAVANMFMVMFCQAETGQVLKGGSKRPSRPCGSL